MKYNFDEIIPRRGTYSVKWDAEPDADVLPMWVADMDFRAAAPIIEALEKRVAHGIFGYTRVPEAYYDAVTDWFHRRHHWSVENDWILYTTGVVPALSAVIKGLTVPGDKVLIQTPVYNCFFSTLHNNDCEIVENPLLYRGGRYEIDFKDLERKAADPGVKLLILCNPHNPGGKVWSREELLRIGDICLQHHLTIIADEIHGELVFPGHTYLPFASLSAELARHTVTCTSCTKAFNVAGLHIANIIASEAELRTKVQRALNENETCEVNPFGVDAMIAAYRHGEEWLEQLKGYLWDNLCYLRNRLEAQLPQFPVMEPEGTYLVWVDCSVLRRSSKEIAQLLLEKGKVRINEGSMYGKDGENFIRINIACPRQTLEEGLERLIRVLAAEVA